MVTADDKSSHTKVNLLASLVGNGGFFALILALAAVVYFDDIQIVGRSSEEVPTIYNVRILGIKIIDAISLGLAFLLALYLVLRERFDTSSFHTNIAIIFLVYCYAGLVGFAYSFFYRYDYTIWVQDFQQTIYMVGFFLLTFHFLDTKRKWTIFAICFLAFLAAKNVLILYWSLTGVGKMIGEWAFRASQNSEFAYFPMMFFPILLLALKGKSFKLKLLCVLISLVYLFNSFVGIYRTVWVMLILGSVYLFFQLEFRTRLRLLFFSTLFLAGTLAFVTTLFPRFLELAWNFKFASIFDWSLSGDRSNATRLLEIVNVTNHVFSNFAFLQGMGLGAWWDDSARRLLPDLGSGFTYKTRFHTTHMWYLTQLLKLGIIAMAFYWAAIYKMFRTASRYARRMPWDRWEKSILVGLNIGLLCAFISSADFVRLFLFIGINLGLIASFLHLDETGKTAGIAEASLRNT